ncbi:Exodeoxyribonuclease VII small subunit [Promicromonospora thailandica]|uniref:Exodeoxyribonuclease 7 small subunit n=1 Tax=Promicromonospora thailandica TaxID=765201 RepID=A0A9X2JUJ9_9MICO|nr:Exodeoxyribonuclease VII small subunit [Promicromonospora thailandica]
MLLTVPVSTDAVTGTDPTKDAPDVAGLSYEQARDELVQVVGRLEAGGEPLEASLALWERGEALAARCQEWLDGARERLAAAQQATAGSADSPEEAR